ncbi:hypothetical protein TNCV_3059361 [Trichonephila clavipes]|nr:hypothetical protein TNCV_3059361 [Trichonephila clavipes]
MRERKEATTLRCETVRCLAEIGFYFSAYVAVFPQVLLSACQHVFSLPVTLGEKRLVQSRAGYKMRGVHDLSRAAMSAYRGSNNFDFIQMVSQAVMSGGQVEFSDRSPHWAIAQFQNSVPPRLVRDTVVEVFLSTGFD